MELRVGGKYRLGRKIGSGSFGDIYLGMCTVLYVSTHCVLPTYLPRDSTLPLYLKINETMAPTLYALTELPK